jgi:NADPH-dependent ferric siderophore reductase
VTTTTGTPRLRREPPRFRRVQVRAVESRAPRLIRVVLGGRELVGMPVPEAAASVRLLLPHPGAELVIPKWTGNEFLLPDGRRPVLRTFTPWRTNTDDDTLAIDVVLHGAESGWVGAAADWAARAEAGMPCALSGPGRGSAPALDATDYLLLGDESAVPAIEQVLAVLPTAARARVVVEVAHDDGHLALPGDVEWRRRPAGDPPGAALVEAAHRADLADDTRVWAAGEAAAMQRIRRHLFEDRRVARTRTTVRGYWKTGTAGDGPGDSDDASG